ncbi:MAG: OmpA family protein, partial [Candidatus Kapaibacteriota bacterium]
GVYDSDSELLIKKGLGKMNDTIQVHDLPQSFKRGKIRCVYERKGKRILIQTDITIRDSTIIQFDSIPIEIGVLYAFDSDSLTKRDVEYLKKCRERLNEKDSLMIEAFTDLSGDYEYNKNLAQRRAQGIVQYFSGIPCTIILSPLKKRNSGLAEYQKAYNRIVTITRKMP